MQTCSKGHVLARDGFYQSRKTGQRVCKPCKIEYSRERHAAKADQINAKRRTVGFRTGQRHQRPTRYGLTVWEYEALYQKQHGVCAICQKPEHILSNHGDPRPLSIDHDHLTGAVRGLLCNSCNRALGLFHDDLGIVEAALWHLRFALRDELVA